MHIGSMFKVDLFSFSCLASYFYSSALLGELCMIPIILSCLIPGLGAAPLFVLCWKQEALAPLFTPSKPARSDP